MSPDKAEMAARLMGEIGYRFQDPELLVASVTHRSFVNESSDEAAVDNQRLEFLGDAVLGLVVASELMRRFPAAQEGVLSRVRASMVDEAALHKLALGLGVPDALRLGRGEELSGGRARASLLADAFEAMIGAAYLDGGLDAARTILDRCLRYPDSAEAPPDPKTELQERLQAAKRPTPVYRLVAEEGPDHAKIFAVELSVDGQVLARGEGRTKKEAERAAATLVLKAECPEARDPTENPGPG